RNNAASAASTAAPAVPMAMRMRAGLIVPSGCGDTGVLFGDLAFTFSSGGGALTVVCLCRIKVHSYLMSGNYCICDRSICLLQQTGTQYDSCNKHNTRYRKGATQRIEARKSRHHDASHAVVQESGPALIPQ